MRTLILTFGVLIIATQVQTRALEFDVFSINKPSVPPTALVSFAIGYPKGWGVTQDPMQQQQDIYFDVVTRDPGPWICTFWPTNVSPTNFANFTIWRSYGATAKDAANQFAENSRKITMLALGAYPQMNFSSVSTSAGDSGWLVESKGNWDNDKVLAKSPSEIDKLQQIRLGPTVAHDYFFHCGNKGSIRITIMTREVDSSFRSELDKMVLQTLRF